MQFLQDISTRPTKQHTCVACGCVFRYPMRRQPTASQSETPFGKWPDPVETHPCPTCGVIQPEMSIWSRVAHVIATLVALVILLGLGAASAASNPSIGLLVQIGFGAFLTLAIVQFGTAFNNPNSERETNRALAQKELALGKLEMVLPGPRGADAPLPRNVTGWHAVPLLLVLAAPAGFVYGLTNLSDTETLPTNAGLTPEVIAPGDEVKYQITDLNVNAVDGEVWRGKPSVVVLNARELDIVGSLSAEGSERQWDKVLHVSNNVKSLPLKPTIRFRIPPTESLAGKTLQLQVSVPMTYAALHNDGFNNYSFVNREMQVERSLRVELVDPSRKKAMIAPIYPGLAGAFLSVIGGLWLSFLALRTGREVPEGEAVFRSA